MAEPSYHPPRRTFDSLAMPGMDSRLHVFIYGFIIAVVIQSTLTIQSTYLNSSSSKLNSRVGIDTSFFRTQVWGQIAEQCKQDSITWRRSSDRVFDEILQVMEVPGMEDTILTEFITGRNHLHDVTQSMIHLNRCKLTAALGPYWKRSMDESESSIEQHSPPLDQITAAIWSATEQVAHDLGSWLHSSDVTGLYSPLRRHTEAVQASLLSSLEQLTIQYEEPSHLFGRFSSHQLSVIDPTILKLFGLKSFRSVPNTIHEVQQRLLRLRRGIAWLDHDLHEARAEVEQLRVLWDECRSLQDKIAHL